jgi:DNA-binding LytR/AlgR family response regulator
MSAHPATALIAEDEPLLAQALRSELARAWPELDVVASVGDGVSAVTQALQLLPDVLFFDIRLPGQDGLQAAAELADEWPASTAFPALVFVTAYDQYAVQAFDAQAVDYLLKPVLPERLRRTVPKVQQALKARAQAAMDSGATDAHLNQTLGALRELLAATRLGGVARQPLKVIQVSVGSSIRLVPTDEVLYFEAADKYLRVLTASQEYLIRTPIKDLLPQLDGQRFWQIHRGTVVQARAIEAVQRDALGRLSLSLRGRPEKLVVSRLHSHQFRAM